MAKRSASPSAVRPPRERTMVALSLPHLPLSLLSQVLEFAVYNFSQNLGPTERSLPPTCLKNVGLVSKSWLHAVLQLMAQFKQETMEIYLKDATRAEIMAIRREILLRGRNVRDFRVKIGKPGSSFGNSDFLIPTKETELLLFNMDWNALFVHLPKLRRLDLKLVPLGSGHLPPILVAAGKFCLQMEVLVLPRKIKLEVVAKGSRIETMLKAVYSSLERCVRKVHPTLKATAYLNGKSGDSFKRFDRLNLIWRPDYSDSGLFVNEEEYNLFYDPSVEGREAAALSFPEPVAASTDEAPRINVFGRLTDMFDELLGPTVHNDYEESSDEDEE
ncbi:uncharacterized protein KRP23_5096 [Phytophthora ramorum]|uniref:uncharacterized protein n=1 Tax=Phytophthora ramorum TaxID=164328 RepID=UPI00309EEFD9|nr:hypothetical protein KRP23_5096 [Phytophthora ramorum]